MFTATNPAPSSAKQNNMEMFEDSIYSLCALDKKKVS